MPQRPDDVWQRNKTQSLKSHLHVPSKAPEHSSRRMVGEVEEVAELTVSGCPEKGEPMYRQTPSAERAKCDDKDYGTEAQGRWVICGFHRLTVEGASRCRCNPKPVRKSGGTHRSGQAPCRCQPSTMGDSVGHIEMSKPKSCRHRQAFEADCRPHSIHRFRSIERRSRENGSRCRPP